MGQRYFREFGAWLHLTGILGSVAVDKKGEGQSPLGQMTQHLILGYIENGDVDSALDLLQSAQYQEQMPSA